MVKTNVSQPQNDRGIGKTMFCCNWKNDSQQAKQPPIPIPYNMPERLLKYRVTVLPTNPKMAPEAEPRPIFLRKSGATSALSPVMPWEYTSSEISAPARISMP